MVTETNFAPEVQEALPSLRDAIYGTPKPTVPQQQVFTQPQQQQPAPQDQPPPPGGEQQQQQQPAPGVAQPFDVNAFLKETLGVDNVEAAKTAWQEYQALKTAPPKFKDPEFPDETGKLIYENIRAGKTSEVLSYLRGQEVLRDFEAKPLDDKLKLYIQFRNPRFDANDVNEEFNETYNINEEGIAPEKLARERKKLEQKKEDDVLMAAEFFQKYKSKIELQAQPDEGYKQYQQTQQAMAEQQKASVEAYQKMFPKDVAFNFKFSDEPTKLTADVAFEPDPESFKETVAALSDQNLYYKRYFNEDGSPRRDVFLRDRYVVENLEKIVAEAQKQTLTAERRRMMTEAKTGGDGTPRDYRLETDGQQQLDQNRQKIYGQTG
jgi:hypothetical protein